MNKRCFYTATKGKYLNQDSQYIVDANQLFYNIVDYYCDFGTNFADAERKVLSGLEYFVNIDSEKKFIDALKAYHNGFFGIADYFKKDVSEIINIQ